MRVIVLFFVVAAAALSAAPQPGTALLVRGGTVIDGTGTPGKPVSIRIVGDAIAGIGADLGADGAAVLDATGLIVAPGFIDVHSHADRGLDEHPDASSQVLQGITTAIVGQDGGSALPIAAFVESVAETRPAINFATSIGHGTVRRVVMGADFKRKATSEEIATMKALVERGMRDGALGLSSGLEYDPGFYAEPGELVELARVAARFGGFYSSHVRDEENEVFDAWREAIDVGRQTGIRVQISHMKLASKPVWGKVREALRILDDAHASGVSVMGDWYPYTYWQSAIYVLIPDRDFENRQKWEQGLAEIGGAANVLITSYRPDPSRNGKTVAEVAKDTGTDAVTTIIEMIRAAGPGIGIIGTSMIEQDLEQILAHPLVIICSDGGLSGRHPRGYGAFPRVLSHYVRERSVVTLEEAIAKMTGRTAAQAGLTDRGVLATGRKADVTIFDPARVRDLGTPRDPAQSPEGIRHVIVNGEIVLRDGKMTGARPGRALVRPSSEPAVKR
jgi:N-acyl-D-amino-acid deacylase